MPAVPSNMMPLGTIAPDFSLLDTVTGGEAHLRDLKGENGTLIMFICNHCPYVKHVLPVLGEMIKEYEAKGISTIAISSNDVANYPEDSPEKMQALAADYDYAFAYLYDETQAVAKAYDAACTPDFYLFDKDLKCAYRGRMDGSTPKNEIPVTGAELRSAMELMLAGQAVPEPQNPSIGCSIKWK